MNRPDLSWLELARIVPHYTCTTPGCRRQGQDLLPSLRTCPDCGQPLTRREVP